MYGFVGLAKPGAVVYNRKASVKYGWEPFFHDICALLMFGYRVPTEDEFADSVAGWQQGLNDAAAGTSLTVDGKLGPSTWKWMAPYVGTTAKVRKASPPPIEEEKKRQADAVRNPASFMNALWPKIPERTNAFRTVGQKARTGRQGLALQLNTPELKTPATIQAGWFAFEFAAKAGGEYKVPAHDAAGKKLADGLSVERTLSNSGTAWKLETAITEKLKVSIGTDISAAEKDEIAKLVAKGEFKKLAARLGSAKLSCKTLSWMENDLAFTTEMPCFIHVETKFILDHKTALGILGWSKEEIADLGPHEGKLELSGTIKLGLSDAAWLAIGRKLGREGIKAGATQVSKRFGQLAFSFCSKLNIALWAVELGYYQLQFTLWLLNDAREKGRQNTFWREYCVAYVYTVGGKAWTLSSPDSNLAKRARSAGALDAQRAMKHWGRPNVVGALLDKFGSEDQGGKIPELTEGWHCEAAAARLGSWTYAREDELARHASVR